MTTRTILGVNFLSGSAREAVDAGLRGGLVVVPSAPVLVGIEQDPALREAVLGADLAITDSGLMVLLWWLLTREKLERVSGLEYLKLLLERLKPETGNLKPEVGAGEDLDSQVSYVAAGGIFWVMPTMEARNRNLAWLQSRGFLTTEADCYVAPVYGAGALRDDQLLTIIRQRRPAHIIIALGGGVQERLGFALKQSLVAEGGGQRTEDGGRRADVRCLPSDLGSYRPGIHCIGAAIGFLSGEQVRIPMWVDYLYLGWLWRSVSAPGKFLPRYWKATRLVGLMIRYRERTPVTEET